MAISTPADPGAPAQPRLNVGSPVEWARAEFRRLLAARTVTGRLQALQAFYPGRVEDTVCLERRCNIVENALEERQPRMWTEACPAVAVAEAELLHDPADSPLPECGLCAAATRVAAGRRFGRDGRLELEAPNTPARAAVMALPPRPPPRTAPRPSRHLISAGGDLAR